MSEDGVTLEEVEISRCLSGGIWLDYMGLPTLKPMQGLQGPSRYMVRIDFPPLEGPSGKI